MKFNYDKYLIAMPPWLEDIFSKFCEWEKPDNFHQNPPPIALQCL